MIRDNKKFQDDFWMLFHERNTVQNFGRLYPRNNINMSLLVLTYENLYFNVWVFYCFFSFFFFKFFYSCYSFELTTKV